MSLTLRFSNLFCHYHLARLSHFTNFFFLFSGKFHNDYTDRHEVRSAPLLGGRELTFRVFISVSSETRSYTAEPREKCNFVILQSPGFLTVGGNEGRLNRGVCTKTDSANKTKNSTVGEVEEKK